MQDKCDKARRKAMKSRDKRLVLKIKKLERDHAEKLDKLIGQAESTMDPRLRQEWKQAEKEFSKFMNNMVLKSCN